MVEVLDQLAGKYGVTTDPEFADIVDKLLEAGQLVKEQERLSHRAELVLQTYKVENNDNPRYYELWYQTRTPFSPADMSCSFGFERS